MHPADGERILDVGVTDTAWRSGNFLEANYPWPKRITAVALNPMPAFQRQFPEVDLVVADGRALPFEGGVFDVGFSNAVVEHVGSREQQVAFVAELLRTCRRVFIATPNARFPIDPHTLLPFIHWLSPGIRYPLLRLFRQGRWAHEEMLNPLSAGALLSLFPKDANVRLVRQRLFGLTTVLIAVAGSGDQPLEAYERRSSVISRIKANAKKRLTDGWARLAAAPARAAPDIVTIKVSERTRLVRRLDYPRADLRLLVTSSIELHTRLHSSQKEPETVQWLERTFTDASVLYDIGANVGAYSLIAAAIGGPGSRVIAIEASPFTFANLCANILLNDYSGRITPLQLLLSERAGIRSFVLGSTIAGEASHPGEIAGSPGLDLAAIPLDGAVRLLDLPTATHLKIDVDGGEDVVLDGARETLRSPMLKHVLIEVESGRTDLGHIERSFAEAGLSRVNVVRHGTSATYNWVYQRLDESPHERTRLEADSPPG
jgi:FkbM family methyltransferase